jgi:hypothetical protein
MTGITTVPADAGCKERVATSLIENLIFWAMSLTVMFLVTLVLALLSATASGPSWVFPALGSIATLWFLLQLGEANRALLNELGYWPPARTRVRSDES